MNNFEKYKNVFKDSFSIDESQFKVDLEYNSIDNWDSIGHMGMITTLEETFEIELDIDDVIGLSSFKIGFEILEKYGITFSNKKG